MKTTVKSILLESLARSNLVPRKRVVPSDMLESAYRLFKSILNKYNYSNFINFNRSAQEIIVMESKIVLNLDGMSDIDTVEYKNNVNDYISLDFVSFELFNSNNDDYIYTWKYDEEGNVELYFKNFMIGKTINVIYSKSLNYELETEIIIPDMYIELFTSALTYKLALTYPRTDNTQVEMLKMELEEIEKVVKQNISSNKILTRNTSSMSRLNSFISGSFLF